MSSLMEGWRGSLVGVHNIFAIGLHIGTWGDIDMISDS